MQTLSQRLRQLRGWQGLTLAQCAKKAAWPLMPEAALKKQVAFESGEMLHEQYSSYATNLAHAYGILPKLLEHLQDEEYAWRVTAGSPTSCTHPELLPRMSRYLRPLPEAAHNLMQDGFVVLDLETTGKSPHAGTQICEITILDTDGNPLLNSLVNPGIHIPDELTANVHGISDEMVRDTPTFREIYPEIRRAIQGQTVCAYNANYDCYLLDRLIIESGLDMPDFEPWCLMEAYKLHIGSERWVKLSVACEMEGVELDGEAHRSLADTISTWRLLQKLAMQHSAVLIGEA